MTAITWKAFVSSAAVAYREGGWAAFSSFINSSLNSMESGSLKGDDFAEFDVCCLFDRAEDLNMADMDIANYLARLEK